MCIKVQSYARMFQTRLYVAYCFLMRRIFNEICVCTFNAAHRVYRITFAICEGNSMYVRLQATCLHIIMIIALHDVDYILILTHRHSSRRGAPIVLNIVCRNKKKLNWGF